MFDINYTGVDGDKNISISYNLLKKTWKLSEKEGKKIYIVPSDSCYIKIEKPFTKKLSQLKSYYALEIEKKFGNLPFEVSLFEDRVYVAVYRHYNENNKIIELEPFALSRVLALLTKDGFIIDIGKRKTTFVYVEGGLLKSYRVVLKGVDFFKDTIIRNKAIGYQEAETLLIERGMEIDEIKEEFSQIIKHLGYKFSDSPVLISGEGAYIKDIKKIFPKVIENNFCKPEFTSALGASLKYVVKNPYPDFSQKTVSTEEIKKFGISLALTLLIFIISLIITHKIYSVNKLKEIQKMEFKKAFPGIPAISIHEQLKTKLSSGEKYELTNKIKNLTDILQEGMTLISFEYEKGVLTIKGEADSSILSNIKPKSTKQTPRGTVEFELELRWDM